MEIEIITAAPPDERDPLQFGLVALTKAISQRDSNAVSHGLLGGEFGYGAHWENDVFLMHPYCWCEKVGECPWCSGGAYENGTGIFARFAPLAVNHQHGYYDPPNFWHKPTNLRVTWYKWIGRDMTTNGVSADLNSVFSECVSSLAEGA